jgi:hypothetical protein
MGLRPRPRSRGVDPSVAQQQLRDAMARTHQIATDLLARAHDIARGFLPDRRYPHHGQRSCHQLAHEQLRVTPIGLDPITRSPRCLRWRDHLHRDPRRPRGARQAVPGRPSLVTGAHRPGQRPEPLDDRADLQARHPTTAELPRRRVDHARLHRARMDVQPYPCHRDNHGQALLKSAVSRSLNLRPDKPARGLNRAWPSTATSDTQAIASTSPGISRFFAASGGGPRVAGNRRVGGVGCCGSGRWGRACGRRFCRRSCASCHLSWARSTRFSTGIAFWRRSVRG